jgi:hypothetical protein
MTSHQSARRARRLVPSLASLTVAGLLLLSGGVANVTLASAPSPVGSSSTAATPTTARPTSGARSTTFAARRFPLRRLHWDQLWLNGGELAKFTAVGHTDADGIPLYNWDGADYYHPVRIELQGLSRIDSYVRTGDHRYIETLRKFDLKLRSMAAESNGGWFLPDTFNYTPEGLEPPWYNTMSQGLGLAFFVRMHRVFGDPADLVWATRLFDSFKVLGPRPTPWVAEVDGGYLWLEHYPGGNSKHVLNAHLHATFGLYDYWQETHSRSARRMLNAAITTMRDNAWRYRRKGHTSLYCLTSTSSSMHYHHLHVEQLRQLARISGDGYFWRLAGRLRQDAW